ncbi:MAG: hypothetical protein OJF49_004706 [Ktedonobacterales bacterium]|jgi:tetratricopeptide (TPR) repeat protein|nr:MAG: hypothetical protein OJF49_004706 [Ktedonobacterales bacterium]
MNRRGSSGDWDDARDSYGPRSARGGPQDSGRRRNDGRGDGRGRSRLSSSQVAAALREAQQLQQEGQLGDAIQICEELQDSGVDRSDVHYFLGWLYQETDRWHEAARQFETLIEDPEYALSCYYALGQCYRAQGDIQQAARFFDEAVDRVNLDALTRDEADQLIQLCQEAAEAHREMNDNEGAETVYTALLGFLRSQGWQDRVSEVERLMRETLGAAPPPRRRKTADASRPVGRNIPQRATLGAGPGRSGVANPVPGMNGTGAMPIPGGTAGRIPVPGDVLSSPPGMGALPDPGFGMPDGGSFGAGQMNGAGMGGAAAYYSSSLPPMAPGDQLAALLHNLSGAMNGARSAIGSLPEPQRSRVADAVRNIENYVAHGLLQAAIEECLRVTELAPQYLDVHLMLAEIYVRQGKMEQAAAKYAVLVDSYLMQNRLDDAIATFRRILQLEPNNLNYRAKLIELLSRQGRLDEVLAERLAAADTYLRLGYTDRAIQEYEQALLASPNSIQVRVNYARALMKAGRAPQAIGEYQRILQVDPNNVNALCQWQIGMATGIGIVPPMGVSMPGAVASRTAALEALGRLLRALRATQLLGYDEVVHEYAQALEANPTNVDLRYALATIQMNAGRHQDAVTSFQQAALGSGMEVLARYGAGQSLLLAGDPVSASQSVRELEEAAAAARRSPPDPAVWAARPRLEGEEHLSPEIEVAQLLAKAYQASGQVAQMQSIQQVVSQQRAVSDEVYQALAAIAARQLDPQTALQEYGQLAKHYRSARQVESAVSVLREMARLSPDDPAVHSEMADIQASRGMLDEALAEMRTLADIHTRRGQLREAAQVYQRMADICWGSGEQPEALNLLRQAMQYSTDDMSLRQQFVQYCLETGRTSEASEQQIVIARFYFASRQTKEAVAALQQLIGMEPHNYEAYDLLGQTYYSVGEYEQAARVYRNLAKVNPNSQMARARLQELQSVRGQMR